MTTPTPKRDIIAHIAPNGAQTITQMLQSGLSSIKRKDITFIKRHDWDIFYCNELKYPLLTAEPIYKKPEIPINRALIDDPFGPDPELPAIDQFTVPEYETYMAYGGSMGHNAPAGQHKASMDVFSDTFKFSNITPQEMVLNSGLWVLFENWTKSLCHNKKLYNTVCFTGSIPARGRNSTKLFKGVKAGHPDVRMNIPSHMFKVIVANHYDHPNTVFYSIYLTENRPYDIKPAARYDLSKYRVSAEKLYKTSHGMIDIAELIVSYGLGIISENKNMTSNIEPLIKVVGHVFNAYPNLGMQMVKCAWYGRLIYVDTLEELEKRWKECLEKHSADFGDMQYHEQFYLYSKYRLSAGYPLVTTN